MLAKRRDKNEQAIIDALKDAGCSVQSLNLRDGPDLLVGFGGRNFLLEIKDSRGKVSDGQRRWHAAWQGQVAVVRTLAEALRIVQLSL